MTLQKFSESPGLLGDVKPMKTTLCNTPAIYSCDCSYYRDDYNNRIQHLYEEHRLVTLEPKDMVDHLVFHKLQFHTLFRGMYELEPRLFINGCDSDDFSYLDPPEVIE